jgi:cystathionine gamma-synthase
VDNTFLSPYYQRPLLLGADLVVHSGTKYLGGHNDTLAGLIAIKDEKLAEELKFLQNSVGGVLAPFDSWLILRGIKTLAVRMDKQQQNAIKIAQWLKTREEVEKVYYMGLPEHEGYEVSRRQTTGFGSMISFTVKSTDRVKDILRNVKVVTFAESLGGVESLITYPHVQTHAAIPQDIRQRLGITDKLLRLSVGIENAEDIIKDLEQALEA